MFIAPFSPYNKQNEVEEMYNRQYFTNEGGYFHLTVKLWTTNNLFQQFVKKLSAGNVTTVLFFIKFRLLDKFN